MYYKNNNNKKKIRNTYRNNDEQMYEKYKEIHFTKILVRHESVSTRGIGILKYK